MNSKFKARNILITGSVSSGKSYLLQSIIDYLHNENTQIGGIVCPAVRDGEQKIGYQVIDISTGESMMLCNITDKNEGINSGKYYFSNSAFSFGEEAIKRSMKNSQVIIVDEIGNLELKCQGWYDIAYHLLKNMKTNPQISCIILSVRKSILNDIIKMFDISDYVIFDIDKYNSSLQVKDIIYA